MNESDPRVEKIRKNAELVISELGRLSGQQFGFDRDSIAWVESFIESQRHQGRTCDAKSGLVSTIGSYLGEAIIKNAGGHWDEDEQGNIAVKFSNGDWCYPFAKVAKQFDAGAQAGESIASFYDISVNYVGAGKLSAAHPAGEKNSGGNA
jgi:hypothetical protein